MWVSHVVDRYTTVLILQLLCMLPEHLVHVQAKDTCQVGQEKNQKGQWRWVLPYEYPCECGKVIYGGMNTVTPKRPFKPVYVKEPMVGKQIGEIRDHYGLTCTELRCPTTRTGTARQGRTTRRFPNETVTAVDNHEQPLNVSCNPSLDTNFPIGQMGVTCHTTNQRGNKKSCTFEVNVLDFDECNTTKSHNCSTNALCVNTDGSYNCSCYQGYKGDGLECLDVDECSTQSHNCSANGLCTNTDGGYNCSCNHGYEGDGLQCIDVDECSTQSHNCSANAACTNTYGGYNCFCNQGYEGDGIECADVDECSTQSHNCSANGLCTNTDGGYNCSCNHGYEGDGLQCIDVDECSTQSHNCSANAACTNTYGGYNCFCNQGYEGDGIECADVDECTTQSHNCSANATCNNTDGGYNCSCNQGYEGDGFQCVDVDECTTQSHNCSSNAACNNTDGSYNCSCIQGYEGDGLQCVDIDECDMDDSGSKCGHGVCRNAEGSFTCDCDTGYRFDGIICKDIDECESNNSTCSVNEVCLNSEGSFICVCDEGYRGDGASCEAYCPRRWEIHADGLHEYCFVHLIQRSFVQAETHCQGMGAELASIHSQAEQDFIAGYTSEDGYNGGERWWGYWIGLNDRITGGVFEWADGTQNDFNFWGDKEPNNGWVFPYIPWQDCVVMSPKKQDKWLDENCHKKYPYICMKTP